MAHFQIRDLCFFYPASQEKPSLENINLSIEKGEYVVTLFFWAPKSLQTVTAAMKLKDACSLEGKL